MATPMVINLSLSTELNRPLGAQEYDANFNALRTGITNLDGRVMALEDGIIGGVGAAITAAINAHLAAENPHPQYISDAPSTDRLYLRSNGGWREFAPQSANGAVSPVRQYTSNAVEGTHSAEEVSLSVSPSGASTAVNIAHRVTTVAQVNEPHPVGSSIGATQFTVSVSGDAFADKIVGQLGHVILTGPGPRSAVLVFEAGIPEISADANVASFAGFYFPNLQGIANIERITTKVAFANQDPRFVIQNMGIYQDSTLRQVVAPRHIGLASGRYYTAPFRGLGFSDMTPGVLDLVPVYVPHRCRINELGVIIQGSVPGARGRFVIYLAEQGQVTRLVTQTGDVDLSTPGNKTASVNALVDGGTYWLGLVASHAVSASAHSPQDSGDRIAMFGMSDPSLADAATERCAAIDLGGYPTGPLPDLANTVPRYLAQDAERHLWFRIVS